VDRICGKYIKDPEALIKRSRILERLKDITKKSLNELSREAEEALEKIDQQLTNLMLKAEKGCRKLYANHYEFNPPVKLWLDRCHSYRALIRLNMEMRDKKTRNPKKLSKNVSNIYCAARSCGIEPKGTVRPLQVSH